MDPVSLYELYEQHSDWSITLLPDGEGVFIGRYGDYLKLISKERANVSNYGTEKSTDR